MLRPGAKKLEDNEKIRWDHVGLSREVRYQYDIGVHNVPGMCEQDMPMRVALSVVTIVALRSSGSTPFNRLSGLILSIWGYGCGRTTWFVLMEDGSHFGSSSCLIVSGIGRRGETEIYGSSGIRVIIWPLESRLHETIDD